MQNEPWSANKLKTNEPTRFARMIESPLFWMLFVTLAFGIPLYQSFKRPQPAQPAVLSQLSDFELTNQDGRTVKAEDLKGSVLVVNFIFTSCADTCPRLTAQMAKIQSRLMGVGPAIRLLSISVDPRTDTPAVLKEYGERYHADFKIWQFLTGPLESIQKVVVEGFKIAAVQEKSQMTNLMEITHGEHFVIVDQLGQIRSYLQGSNDAEINQIVRTVAILANSNPRVLTR